MRVLLINPPYPSRIIRRYICSYNASNFLLPPLELMYLSAQAKSLGGVETRLLDCIAAGLSLEEALAASAAWDPDVVVAIMAIEYFDNDVTFLQKLKERLPGALIGCFGHLPSHHGAETLAATGADFVMAGEPDLAFRAVLERLQAGEAPVADGIGYFRAPGDYVIPEFQRTASLDELPFADQGAIDHSRYGEPFFGKPYTTFLSSRGCPFHCNYCVRTYGRSFAMASAGHIVAEVTAAVSDHGIRCFRFMDDTFTVSRRRVFEICAGLRELPGISWSCLTRPNTITGEVAEALKDAGCRRIYVGLESGSQKVLDYFGRGYRLEKVVPHLQDVRDTGLEIVGWFIVGAPVEGRGDFEASLRLARTLRLGYIVVSTLVPYPDTKLFELERGNIDFSLIPYNCQFHNQASTDREAEFYRRFYLRPSFVAGKLGYMARHPGQTLRASTDLVRYTVAARRDPYRKDLL